MQLTNVSSLLLPSTTTPLYKYSRTIKDTPLTSYKATTHDLPDFPVILKESVNQLNPGLSCNGRYRLGRSH